ncbi:MAG: SUMF1/EgtB/PvdO family nonheme iron enzyme [Planctomycetaceae bacterium]|nr:SUMF1/EgtB/PvdO family nonheme iron enzyme [Planctomycetaceae bacterium]
MRIWSGLLAVVASFWVGSSASAATITTDSFGVGESQFSIEFVTISGATNPTRGHGIVDHDYRIGVFEITNVQFSKFAHNTPFFSGDSIPANRVSWYEAAQFVNWLNTSTGHHVAYNFTSDGEFSLWSDSEAAGGTNLYRHKDACYYLPTGDEWVKAAYWNGTSLQTHTTGAGYSLLQRGGRWGYCDNGHTANRFGPSEVGSGGEELNGTYDMMGNMWEWLESPYAKQTPSSSRGPSDEAFSFSPASLRSSFHFTIRPMCEYTVFGLRVAASAPTSAPTDVPAVPEPASLLIWACGGLGALLLRRRRE